MPSAPPAGTPFWTLNANNISGGSDGQKLVGCHVVEWPTNFTFTKPDWTVLATSTGTTRPSTAFTFPTFDHRDITGWSIGMPAPPTDTTQNWGADSWSFPPQTVKRTGGQSGTFTAQADGTPVDAEDAASAKA